MAVSTRIIPTVQNPDLVTATVLVDGKEIPRKLHLTHILLHSEINKIPFANLTILDGETNKEDFEISSSGDFLPGKKVEIRLGYHNENDAVFKGIIITNTHRAGNHCSELHIECKDETVGMTINKGNRHYNDVRDSDVAERILGEHKIKHTNIDPTDAKHEQLLQSNVSDWDYMIGRIDINGMLCVINNGEATIKKPDLISETTRLELTYGANILEFHADMDARTQTAVVKTLSWDFENQKVVSTESEDSKAPEEGDLSRGQLAAVTNQPLEMRTSATLSQKETQNIANAKQLKQDLSKIKAKVKYQGTNKAQPGDFITIKGVGKNFNGRAFVSAIQHEYADGDWVTEATLGWNEQFFSEQTNPHHPASTTGHTSSMQGLQIGVVTGITDNSGQYRVKIRFPLVNEGDDGIYARVATLDAGNKRGTFFRPELHDEVVVGFMNDNPNNPVILGMLHSSAKAAPLEPATANPEKGYVSRSGIKLIFNDDKKSIHIETPGNRVFEMNDASKTITVKDHDGNKMVIDQNGISVESVKDITIKAGNSISISAPQVSLKADGTMSVEGSGRTSVSSSGITEIRGSLVKIN